MQLGMEVLDFIAKDSVEHFKVSEYKEQGYENYLRDLIIGGIYFSLDPETDVEFLEQTIKEIVEYAKSYFKEETNGESKS